MGERHAFGVNSIRSGGANGGPRLDRASIFYSKKAKNKIKCTPPRPPPCFLPSFFFLHSPLSGAQRRVGAREDDEGASAGRFRGERVLSSAWLCIIPHDIFAVTAVVLFFFLGLIVRFGPAANGVECL